MKKILLFVYPTFAEFEITVATALLKNNYEIITAPGHAFVHSEKRLPLTLE